MRGRTALLSLCALAIGSFPTCRLQSLYAQQPPARSPTTFQEMSFVLPPGTWEQSPGSPPSLDAIFTRKGESGRVSTFGVSRVEYDLPMYGLSRAEHASKVLDLERQKPRPYGVWRGFEQGVRTIGTSRHDVMSFQMLYPTEAAPTVVADGLFLVYFPTDFESRERFYVLTWIDSRPTGEARAELAELDSVVSTFAVSAKGAAPSIPTFLVHAPLEKAWTALQSAVGEADLAVVTSDSTTHVVQTGVMVFSARNRLAGMGIGDVVDCGRNVGIARTRSGTTMVQLTATVRGTGDSSTVRVQLDARNHDETSVFANKDRSCTSKGALERRLGARVEQLVKPPGSED